MTIILLKIFHINIFRFRGLSLFASINSFELSHKGLLDIGKKLMWNLILYVLFVMVLK